MSAPDHFIMLHPWGAIAVGVDGFFHDRARARCQVAERRGCTGSVLAGPVGKDLGDGGVPASSGVGNDIIIGPVNVDHGDGVGGSGVAFEHGAGHRANGGDFVTHRSSEKVRHHAPVGVPAGINAGAVNLVGGGN